MPKRIAWNKGLKGVQLSIKKGKTIEEFYGKEKAEEIREKMKEAKKDFIPWNKGKKLPQFSGENNPFYGKHHTEETKKIMRKKKENYIPWNKGLTKETDERIEIYSKKMKGIQKSERHRNNLSKSLKGKYIKEKNPFYGKKHTKEMREYLSQKRKRLIKEGKIKIWHKGKEFLKMEKNPNWRGGISFEPYDENFNKKFRNFIRKRDNQICMLCRIHREKLTRALCVHHINYDKLLSIPQNCVSLCISCHGKTHYNRKHWIKFFQSLLSEKYGYKYSEDNKIILKIKNEH